MKHPDRPAVAGFRTISKLVHQPQGPVIAYTGTGSIHGAAKGRALRDDEIR